MNAQQTNLEVIANNIANINTTGYKRARAEFSDLLYQVDRTQGVPNRSNASLVPEGVSIGLGVKTTAVRNVHTQGELTSTGNSFDMTQRWRRSARRMPRRRGFSSKASAAISARRCRCASTP